MKRRRGARRLAVFGFNLALFLALLELVGLVDHFRKTGKLYYLDRPTAAPLADSLEPIHALVSYRLHPYFGYIVEPGPDAAGQERGPYNNHGFEDARDYPYTPRGADEVVVGIFGGSVASKLHTFESRRGALAGRVAAALGRRRGDVTLLNFAQGGYKQPQQLLIYDYFSALGQRFDVVINVDGFNEVALAAINVRRGIAVDMPSADHVGVLREIVGRVEEGESLDRVLRARLAWRRYARMHRRARSGDTWERRFAAGFFIDRKLAQIYRKRYRAAVEAVQRRSAEGGDAWLYLSPGSGSAELGEDDLSAAVDLWARSSALMHSRPSRGGALYLHFLQPNQYHATRRTFDERERAVAFHPASLYAEPSRRGYPRLRQEAARLRAEGVRVHDLSEVFDGVAGEVYADSCCHHTDAGQEVLADAIAAAVVAAIEERKPGGGS